MHLINFGGGGKVIALKSATALILDRWQTVDKQYALRNTNTLTMKMTKQELDYNDLSNFMTAYSSLTYK